MGYNNEKQRAKLDLLRWKAFKTEYYALLEKYNVEMNEGCGCCSDDPTMDGISYNWGGLDD